MKNNKACTAGCTCVGCKNVTEENHSLMNCNFPTIIPTVSNSATFKAKSFTVESNELIDENRSLQPDHNFPNILQTANNNSSNAQSLVADFDDQIDERSGTPDCQIINVYDSLESRPLSFLVGFGEDMEETNDIDEIEEPSESMVLDDFSNYDDQYIEIVDDNIELVDD